MMVSFKNQVGAHFDTFPCRGVRVLIRQIKGAVGGEPGPAIVNAVPALDQQHFIPPHFRHPVPFLCRAMGQAVDFTDPVLLYPSRGQQISRFDAGRVRQGQERTLDGPLYGPPDIDLHDAAARGQDPVKSSQGLVLWNKC